MPAEDWKNSLARAIRDPEALIRQLELSPQLVPAAVAAGRQFPLRVPREFIDRMEKGNPDDPLLLQVLPLHLELTARAGFSSDPTGDLAAMKTPGLLHKYQGRILLITTGACAIHCRYCFRRHFPYNEAHLDQQAIEHIVQYLAKDPGITEVILSGGDPLSLSDDRLVTLISRLEQIPHLKRMRFHTRLPVIVPARVTPAFIELCRQTRLTMVMVIHSNHANELDVNVAQALQSLRDCGITLFNQTVLLKKINDNVDSLITLSETLFHTGVQPYYLHQLDRVRGAAHFAVDDDMANTLHEQCRRRLPGYLVPRLVREVVGQPYKVPIGE